MAAGTARARKRLASKGSDSTAEYLGSCLRPLAARVEPEAVSSSAVLLCAGSEHDVRAAKCSGGIIGEHDGVADSVPVDVGSQRDS